jgi:hypothetical protein
MFAFLKRILIGLKTSSSSRREGHFMNKGMRKRLRAPRVNSDGTPMAGRRHDIRGRGYGSGGGFGSSKY